MATPTSVHALTPRGSRAVEPISPPWEHDLRALVERALRGQYELGEEIGRGGMGVVYRAVDRRLEREVAIKVLPPELAYTPAIRTRFIGEARTAAQLGHPHIVPIYDVGEHDGVAFLVMGLVTGDNLATLLGRDPRPPIPEIRRILAEIADALAYAHRRGVIHRDIKPDNILLDAESGRAIVTDFGIARAIEAGTRLTVTGMAVGTPTYMSPEQAVGERELDGRSDVYALGVLGYQMLTGRVPFSAGNPVALLMKQVTEQPRPIVELRPDAPEALRGCVERALAKSPDDRWPSAAAFRDALTKRDAAPVWRREAEPEPEPERALPARIERAAILTRAPAVAAPSAPDLQSTTPEQRQELRLWLGRVDLLERVKAFRRHAVATLAAAPLALVLFAAGIEEIPPLVLAPLVPLAMSVKLWRRALSLRASGLQVRRALLMPRAKWALPAPPALPGARHLAKLAPAEVIEGPHGALIRRAAEDRAVILDMLRQLPEADRALVPDVEPTVNALLERVVGLAQALRRLDHHIDPDLERELAAIEAGSATPDGQRRRALLQRQRATLDALVERRAQQAGQLETAGLALRNLRLDLIKLRSSGLHSAITDVSSATQEARALSREIGAMLDAAAEIREL